MFKKQNFASFVILIAFLFAQGMAVIAQYKAAPEILNQTAAKIVPTSFYFAGQSASTQMIFR